MNRTRNAIADLVGERLSSTGVQLAVCSGGVPVVDLAVGDAVGSLMSSETVHNTYCLSKFVLSVGVACVCEEAGVGLDARLGDLGVGDDLAGVADGSLGELLDHALGLRRPPLVEYRMLPAGRRGGWVREGIAERGSDRAYSEVVFGLVAEAVIEWLSGKPAAEYLYSGLFEPLGISDDVAVEPSHAHRLLERGLVSAPVGGLPVDEWPMLSELLPGELDGLRPGVGVIWSMRSAATFASAVLDAAVGRPSRVPLSAGTAAGGFMAPERDAFYDDGASRELQFSSGMMVGPPLRELCPSVGPRSFGHLAGVATAVLFCDPDHDVVVALYLNGVDLEHSLAALDRSTVVRAVYEDLGVG